MVICAKESRISARSSDMRLAIQICQPGKGSAVCSYGALRLLPSLRKQVVLPDSSLINVSHGDHQGRGRRVLGRKRCRQTEEEVLTSYIGWCESWMQEVYQQRQAIFILSRRTSQNLGRTDHRDASSAVSKRSDSIWQLN
jgi:hypothetical protein